jgi:hypothetical protein
MSNKKQIGERHIRVRGIRREQPDLQKLSRALLDIVFEQAKNEAEAEAEHKATEDAERGINKGVEDEESAD